MKAILILITVLSASLAFCQETHDKENPGSLFTSGKQYNNPLTDRVARRMGDVLTVIIKESTISNYSASTNTSKADTGGFTPAFVVDFFTRIFRPFSASSNASQSGQGKTTHTNTMDSTMSVVVKQVLPNGNLIVEGNRSLTTNKDTETLVFSGIVRPYDIKPDNTVISTQIAEVKLAIAGKGTIADRQRKGLINSLLDWLF